MKFSFSGDECVSFLKENREREENDYEFISRKKMVGCK